MRKWPFLLALLTGCTSAARGYCEAAAACDEQGASLDVVGASDDSVDVCEAEQQGLLDTLRANDEQECHDLADETEAYFACVRDKAAEGEECAGLRNPNSGDNECDDELDDVKSAQREAGDACGE